MKFGCEPDVFWAVVMMGVVLVFDHTTQAPEVFFRQLPREPTYDRAFEVDPYREEIARLLQRGPGHDGAAIGPELDQLFGRQHFERTPHDGAARSNGDYISRLNEANPKLAILRASRLGPAVLLSTAGNQAWSTFWFAVPAMLV